MNTQGKIWGKTSRLFEKNNVIIERIEIHKGTHCSEHKHEHRFNAFFVESGEITIKRWKNDYDLVDETRLRQGEMTTVPPGEFHQFQCHSYAVVYEIYWVELDGNDIVRRTVGGKND